MPPVARQAVSIAQRRGILREDDDAPVRSLRSLLTLAGRCSASSSAAERLDQQHGPRTFAGFECRRPIAGPTAAAFSLTDHLQVGDEAALVLELGLFESARGGRDGRRLAGGFGLEIPQGGKIVFHFLVGGEHGLPVSRHLLIVAGMCLG